MLAITTTGQDFGGPLVNLTATDNAAYDSLGNQIHAATMVTCSAVNIFDSVTVTNTKTNIAIDSMMLVPVGVAGASIQIPLP
jgi:hypothetical protein